MFTKLVTGMGYLLLLIEIKKICLPEVKFIFSIVRVERAFMPNIFKNGEDRVPGPLTLNDLEF